MMTSRRRNLGFTLLEVIIALAMLALIAIPAVGLATMAVSRSKEQMATGSASELKTRVDTALRSLGSAVLFGSDFISEANDLTFVASKDLRFIERESGTVSTENDKFYRVWVKEPEGYSYTSGSPFRLMIYEVTWPYNSADTSRNQLFFTSVFRK